MSKKKTQESATSVRLTESYLSKYFTPIFSFTQSSKITVPDNFDNSTIDFYANLSDYYFLKGLKDNAEKWALKGAEQFNNPEIPVSFATIKLGGILLKTDHKEKGLFLLENMATRIYRLFTKPSANNIYIAKDFARSLINEIEKLLTETNVYSEQVNTISKKLAD